MIFFLLFIISALSLGSYLIGPFSVRVYMTIVIFICLLYYRYVKNFRFYLNYSSIYLYLIFILLTFIAKIFSGPFELNNFFKDLLAFHFVSIVSFFAVDLFVKNRKQIELVILILVLLASVNSIASILQYYNIPLGLKIAHIFSNQDVDYLDKFVDLSENSAEIELGDYVVPGIFIHGAINGGLNATLGILSLFFFFSKKTKVRWFFLFLFLICFVGSFIIQERSPMGLFIIFLLLCIWKFTNRKKIIVYLFLILIVIFFTWSLIPFSMINLGRFSEMTNFNSERQILFNNALDFISDNWLLGGDYLYHQLYKVTPHNFILHAIISSGIFGAFVIFWLFIKMVKQVSKIIYVGKLSSTFFLSCALLIYLLNGLTHSGSLVTGDTIIWILYSLILRNLQIDIYEDSLLFQRAKDGHVSMAKSSYL